MSFLQSTGARRKVPGLIRKPFLPSPYAGLMPTLWLIAPWKVRWGVVAAGIKLIIP